MYLKRTRQVSIPAPTTRPALWISLIVLGALIFSLRPTETPAPHMIGMADLDTLLQSYERWRSARDLHAAPASLRIPLGYSKALSPEFTTAKGRLTVDVGTGHVQLSLTQLPVNGHYKLWWVDNQPGPDRSVRPESGDRFIDVGQFVAQGDRAVFETRVNPQQLATFNIDLAVIAPAAAGPTGGVIFGAPSAFQQLQTRQRLGEITEHRTPSSADPLAAIDVLLPGKAVAHEPGVDLETLLGERVAHGRDLFLNETFGGNGRTCASCHRPDNNHTIDPAYIARLPRHDPLFVAETNPALKKLEKPALMRKFGLILTNLDGYEADRPPVMRSVPHLLGLANSIAVEIEDEPLTQNAIGWSGDGAPAPGSLKMFAAGAIVQHFPQTLERVAGRDFRLPTDEELEDLELYMLSLGRGPGEELDLKNMAFKADFVEKGKLIFDTKQNATDERGNIVHGTGNCNGCHENAGANSSTTKANPTRDTGIENLPDHPARKLKPTMAFDGGFGTVPNTCGPQHSPCFGDHRFNTTSLIEAADTGPFFHNNVVNTLEEAIATYNQPAFNESPGALTSSGADRTVILEPDSINAVGAFLRTINALENIRSSNKLDTHAKRLNDDLALEMIRLAAAETRDALDVLRGAPVAIYPEAVQLLQQALWLEQKARGAHLPRWWRNIQLRAATALKYKARQTMVTTP